MDTTRTRWSSQTKLVVSLLLLAGLIYLLFRFRQLLIPLILALILAFVISPLVKVLQNNFHIRRVLATFLCYLLLLAVAILLPIAVFPLLASQIKLLNLDIQLLLKNIESLVNHQYVVLGQTIDGLALFRQSMVSLQGLLQPIFGITLEFAVDLISSLVWVIFVTVVSFYFVKDGPALRSWMESHVPQAWRHDFTLLRDEINTIWSSFFRGQILLALVVALIFITVGVLLGLPFALVMGILAGLLEFLPSVGHGIWLFIAATLSFFIGSTWLPLPKPIFMLIVIALHLFYQQFDLNYLIPRIIGRSVRLPPLVVILGIVAGALFAGVLGILLAAPTIASARVLARYIFANLLDLEPFPESILSPLPPPNPRWWRLYFPRKPFSRTEKKTPGSDNQSGIER